MDDCRPHISSAIVDNQLPTSVGLYMLMCALLSSHVAPLLAASALDCLGLMEDFGTGRLD